MGRGRHDALAPVDHPASARELAGGSSVSLVANASSAKVVAVNDGEASTPNVGAACPEYTPTPLFTFDVQGARVTVWPAQSSGNARNRIGEGGEEDDNDSDDANRIGDNGNCLNHIVYLHVYDGDGLDVLSECQRIGCPPFTLVAIKPAPGRAGMRQTQQSPHLPHRRGLFACRAFRHLDSTQFVGLLPHCKRFGLALVSRFRALCHRDATRLPNRLRVFLAWRQGSEDPKPTSAQRCNGNGRGCSRISQQGGTDAIRVEPRQPL